jgi:hypothetical protein
MLDSIRLQELQNLLESYDMINTVRSPTRITSCTESLIDVITNTDNSELRASVVDLGFSYHLAQIVRINIGKGNRGTKTVVRRQLTNNGTEELKNLLSNESWNEVFNHADVNSSLKAFLNISFYYFDIAFPYKRVKLKEIINKGRLSKGLTFSSKRMQILNNLKRTFTLMREALIYIKKIREYIKEY